MTPPKPAAPALAGLADHGQSIWLDYIRRGMTREGGIARLVERDSLRGMTSNPAIFLQAITGSADYDGQLRELLQRPELSPKDLYEALAIVDIQEAADALRPVYESTNAVDGYVSLEVAPGLAQDAEGTIAEARRLWQAVARPNLMIKVPGTPQGLRAIEELTADGINVNVTLIFAREMYEMIAECYVRGLQRRADSGGRVDNVASVASFFVSRIDSAVDKELKQRIATAQDPDTRQRLQGLLGKAAVANAKLAYARYQAIYDGPRWKALAERGARPQRLLWASTGTKDPAYPDTLYVDELIGPNTVNTVPPQTLDAFRDHGTPRASLTTGVEEAKATLKELSKHGVSLDRITSDLLLQGLHLFVDAMDDLFAALARKQREALGARPNAHRLDLGGLQSAVERAASAWDASAGTTKLWNKDASLWTGRGEDRWLGWLDAIDSHRRELDTLEALASVAPADIIVLGMGGSSLCPDVLARTYGDKLRKAGGPRLQIVDSTVPDQIAALERSLDLQNTLFVVSSKSGSTLEPNVFMHYFLGRVSAAVASEGAKRFFAVTDPGSELERFAKEQGFAAIFRGEPTIGGRYSAFSNFGLVPAALMGLDVKAWLDEANVMAQACRKPSALENPGVMLGLVMGEAAKAGRDKLTIVLPSALAAFGAWVEQLVAESTGKQGQAIIPVDGEVLATPEKYGDDRLFVHLRLAATPDAAQDRAVAALKAAGHPVVELHLPDTLALSQEFFRWEIATAVAGAVMRLNPFDQPDVEAAKIATRSVMQAFESSGSLPDESPVFSAKQISLFTDANNAAALGRHDDLLGYLRAHLRRIQPGDYFALLGFIAMTPEHELEFQHMRHAVRDAKKVATCVGFGPRFLHSTGQAYKGGANNGVFVQVTGDDGEDLAIPGFPYSFGIVKAAQARGDFDVLAERGRRVIRIHLHGNVHNGLQNLGAMLREALRA